jgi:hypothetical protein
LHGPRWSQARNEPRTCSDPRHFVGRQIALKLYGVKEICWLGLPTFIVIVNDGCGDIKSSAVVKRCAYRYRPKILESNGPKIGVTAVGESVLVDHVRFQSSNASCPQVSLYTVTSDARLLEQVRKAITTLQTLKRSSRVIHDSFRCLVKIPEIPNQHTRPPTCFG